MGTLKVRGSVKRVPRTPAQVRQVGSHAVHSDGLAPWSPLRALRSLGSRPRKRSQATGQNDDAGHESNGRRFRKGDGIIVFIGRFFLETRSFPHRYV
jgi:hypothetical protein